MSSPHCSASTSPVFHLCLTLYPILHRNKQVPGWKSSHFISNRTPLSPVFPVLRKSFLFSGSFCHLTLLPVLQILRCPIWTLTCGSSSPVCVFAILSFAYLSHPSLSVCTCSCLLSCKNTLLTLHHSLVIIYRTPLC